MRPSFALTDQAQEEANIALWREMLDLSGIGTYSIDTETLFCDWSPRVHEVLDVEPDDPTPLETWRSRVHELDRDRVYNQFEIGLASSSLLETTYRLVTRTGDVRWIEVRGKTYFWGGKPWRRMGTIIDVTDRMSTATDSTDMISVAEFDSFTSSVAHDFKTPIRAIQALASELMEDHGQDLSDAIKAILLRQISATNRLSEQINALQGMLRTCHGPIRPQPLHIGNLFLTEWKRFGTPEAAGEDATLSVDNAGWVQADARLMKLVAIELLKNSVQHRNRKAPLRIVVSQIGPGIEGFRLTDNGLGFDPAYAKKVFDPFNRINREDGSGRNGLGLALVQRIAERHGAVASATSELGVGTTITVRWVAQSVKPLP